MSRYSDETTVGGQVLAHRFRMMTQNWRIIAIVGYFTAIIFFIVYTLLHFDINEIWNYLCSLKSNLRMQIPGKLFKTSYLLNDDGKWLCVADSVINRSQYIIKLRQQIEAFVPLNLKISLFVGLFSSFSMVLINKKIGRSISKRKELISGSNYVTAKRLQKAIFEKSDITLAGVAYPKSAETRHTIITGTTGAGKTNVMRELINQIKQKQEKAIIVDTVGNYLDEYYDYEQDILLNPLDYRAVPWSFLEECTQGDSRFNEVLLRDVASCLIDGGNVQDKFWEDAAKITFVETAKKVIIEGKSTAEFMDTLLKTNMREIQKYLKGTYGAMLMSTNAEKMSLSIRAMLINSISVFEHIKESNNNFSIRKWILNDTVPSCCFLSCRPAERATIVPMITTWLSIASEALLHKNPTERRTWFIIDELHSLKRLPKIESSLAEVRKFGGCFVIGTQLVSQLNSIYGQERSKTITGLCGNKIVMCTPEPVTAKYMSGFLGEKEEAHTQESISYGAHAMRDGANISEHNRKENTAPASEIMQLKSGEAFLQFANIPLTAKVKFKLHKAVDACAVTKNVYEITSEQVHTASGIISHLRKKQKKVVVFDTNCRIYDQCHLDGDILLDNKEYGLDLLDDLTDEELIEVLLNAADLNSEKRAEAKEYLDYMMSNIAQFAKSKTTVTVLNSMIFSSIGKIPHGYKLEKYANIRTELATNLEHLKPYIKTKSLISIKSYIHNKYFDNKIIFAQIDHYILNTCIQNTGKDKLCCISCLNQHIFSNVFKVRVV